MSNSSSCSSRPTKSRSTLPLSLASSDGSNCTLVGSTSTGSGASNGGSHVAFNGNEECKLPSVASSRQFSVVNSGGNSRLVGGSATTITENVDTTPGSKSSKANGDNMASTNSSTPNYVPSPEIMFMVREHAKTISAISSISKRLEQLEVKVCDIQKNVTQCNSSNSKTEPKASTSSTVPQVLSDDSGGEYSRTTNGTNVDEDELLSLLDQIAKCSQQIRETQQAQLGQQSALMNSLPRDSVVAPPPPPPLQSSTAHPGLYDNFSLLGSTRQLTVPSVSGRELQLHPVHLPAPPAPAGHQTPTVCSTPLHPRYIHNQSSLSALLDPNVDRFLNTLQQELSTDNSVLLGPQLTRPSPLMNQMPAASTMSTDSSSAALFSPFIPLGVSTPLHNPTSSSSTRELLMQSTMSANSIMASSGVGSNHGSPSSGIAVMIGNTMIGSGNTTSAGIGSNWRMDRSRQLIRQREHEEAENQLDLAEQWLATHIMKVAAQKRHPLN